MAEAIGVPGAITWGKTLPEAKRMMTEAIEGLLRQRPLPRQKNEVSFE